MVTSVFFLIIFLLFPFLAYFIYLVYSDLTSSKEKDFILDLVLLTSFYLANIQGYITTNTIILINVPLIISLIKRRHFSSMLIIILIIMKYHLVFPNINIMWFLLEYSLIFIVSNIIKKYEIGVFLFIKLFFIISIVFLLKININILDLILKAFIIYILFVSFKYVYTKIEGVVLLRVSFAKTIKEQKRFQDLFKIAHEVKNPLAVCKGYLQMINTKDSEKKEKYIQIISMQIDKTLEILKDFSNISNLKITKEDISLNLLMKEIIQEVSIFNTLDVSIKTNVPSTDIIVNADFNRLKQVLLNVIKNAKESITEKGTIEINLYKKKKYAYIKVVDSGVGMDCETLANLYKPFFTTKKNGTGLGVCLSKEIIEKHNGKMEYYSKVNKGTKVFIKLPLKKASI